jgi:hypothetical protein
VLEREALRKPGSTDALRAVAGSLDPVAKSLFGAARTFVRAQRALVRRLDDAPEPVERGDFSLKDPNEIGVGRKLLRIVGLDRNAADLDPIEALERELAAGTKKLEKPSALAKDRPESPFATRSKTRADLAELRALVDETLEGP